MRPGEDVLNATPNSKLTSSRWTPMARDRRVTSASATGLQEMPLPSTTTQA